MLDTYRKTTRFPDLGITLVQRGIYRLKLEVSMGHEDVNKQLNPLYIYKIRRAITLIA